MLTTFLNYSPKQKYGEVRVNEKRILKQIAEIYDKIYELEKQRKEINKKIKTSKTSMNGLLAHIRNEIKGDKK